jgi:simple sugar transport system substrate-binding protein
MISMACGFELGSARAARTVCCASRPPQASSPGAAKADLLCRLPAPTGFHGYLARGAAEAGKNLGVKVTYIYPDELTIPNQGQKIEEAVAAKANGIALCEFAEDAAYVDVAKRAKDAGIAFGSAAAPPAGAQVRDPNDIFLFRTGLDEKAAGALTGKRLIAMGIKGGVVVVDQQPGDATCRDRADSEISALKAAGIKAEFLESSIDPGRSRKSSSTICARIRIPPPRRASATSAPACFRRKRTAAKNDLIVTGDDLDAVKNGRQAFTIDQQQFWRGYMPVLLLTHYLKYGLIEANYFLTGPTVVDKSNIDQVAKLVTAGFR